MKQIVLFAILAIVFSSCNSSTSSNPSGGTTIRPGVGSKFVIHQQTFDTSNRVIDDRIDTVSVIASGTSFAGKTNVVTFKRSNYISYGNYEANGDMSTYIDGQGAAGEKSGWLLVPIVSKGTASMVVWDTTYISNGTTVHYTGTTSYTFAGEQTITAAGENFVTERMNTTETYSSGSPNYNEIDYLAPRIGYIVKIVNNYTHPDSRGAIRQQVDLLSYSLK